jgi:hypothetical protein
MTPGIQPVDYKAWHDRFVRYMCIQRREKNQITFSLYEFALQTEICGSGPAAEVQTDSTPDGKGVYRVIAETVINMLIKEQLLELTLDTNMYQMTDKLIEVCGRNHGGTYGFPSE